VAAKGFVYRAATHIVFFLQSAGDSMAQRIATAFDVGAGNCKVAASVDGKIVKSEFFPSVVSLASTGSLASFQSERNPSNEVTPIVDGVTYKVSKSNSRNLTGATRVSPGDDFQSSAYHMALLATALHAVELQEIDVMVLGTPVHTFNKQRERLQAIRGQVDFGLGKHYIGTTIVLPQPFGSLLSAMNEGLLPNVAAGGVSLVVDAGYFTIDVVRARALAIQNENSFSLENGMGKIYRMIADAISHQIRKPVNNLDQIEFCLRTSTPYQIYGKQFFLEQFTRQIQAQIDAIVLELYGRAGTTEDLSCVCLTGGGAEFFAPAIRKMFGDVPVHVMRDPLMANVRGFLIAAQSAAANRAS
jgi:plasmid segregation protein ParM